MSNTSRPEPVHSEEAPFRWPFRPPISSGRSAQSRRCASLRGFPGRSAGLIPLPSQRCLAGALLLALLAAPAALTLASEPAGPMGPGWGAAGEPWGRPSAPPQWFEHELARLSALSERLEHENEGLLEDLERAIAQLARLKQQLATVEGARAQAEQALREREATVAGLQGELSRLEQVLERAETARDRLVAENAQLVAERAGIEAERREHEELRRRLAERTSDEEELRGRLAELEAIRDRTLGANLSLQAENRTLQEGQLADRQALGDLRREVESLQAERQAAEQRQATLTEERARLETQLAEQRQLLAAAEGQWAGERTERDAALVKVSEEAEDLRQRVKVLEETHKGALAAVERLTADKGELQQRLEATEKATAEAADQRAALEQELAALREQAAGGASASSAEVERIQAEHAAQLDRLAQAHRAEVAAQASEREALARDKAALAAEVERLQAALAAQVSATHTREALTAELAAARGQTEELAQELAKTREALAAAEAEASRLRGQLPVAAGGALTEEELRAAAAEQLRALRQLYQERGAMGREQWNARREELVEALRQQQFALAQAIGARSLHRVQRNDTLASISLAVYGRSGNWQAIFEANRHLLENPDQLFPGMTLVIP